MPRIGITIGDPAGIGPEIIRAALAHPSLQGLADLVVIGDPTPAGVRPGMPDAASARAALDALERAIAQLRARRIDALVTAPISKSNLHRIGFPFPGHTEFLAHHAGTTDFAMALTAPQLTVALVTIHLPLADAIRALNPPEIARVGTLLAQFLHRRLGRHARIAVAGLNPHAGEDGALGSEEEKVIRPALGLLREACAHLATFDGPLPPDTLFHRVVHHQTHDGVLCMYHDQGLIPFKLLAFDSGVNVTLGLPFIRTSPDHGTAFDIAGRNLARPDSMISAIRLAIDLAKQAVCL